MTIFRLAWQSLRNRSLTAFLTVLAIAASVMLLLGVEKIRHSARASFANTISGVDIVLGARGGDIQLLLYSVFHIGDATNNLTWTSYQDVTSRREVAWSVPISLGDNYRGSRVVGTSSEFFSRYKYRNERALAFAEGKPFSGVFTAVLGRDVAEKFGHKLGDIIALAHGTGTLSSGSHADMPFQVVGILERTGTPIDRSVLVSLESIEAIHVNWRNGAPSKSGFQFTADQVRQMQDRLKPKAITAAMIGLKSPLSIFTYQRFVNRYRREPLTGAVPALTLHRMWSLVGTAETALLVVSAMVVLTAILGMITMIFSTLNERRREIAILRAMGAGPKTVIGLLVSEAAILSSLSVLLGLAATYIALTILQPMIDRNYGIFLEITAPTTIEVMILAAIVAAGILAGLLPAIRAYALSLADGMMVRN